MTDVVARNIRIEERETTLRVACDIVSDGFPETLFFDVDQSAADAVEIDEPNWVLLSLLYPAMLLGRDIRIEADLSPYLLNNARNDLMHLVRNYHPTASQITIEAGVPSAPPAKLDRQDVVTGFSCGVDSFATVLKYMSSEVPDGARLTGASLYQVGALVGAKDLSIIHDALARIRPVVDDLGLVLYSLASNMEDLYTEVLRQKRLGITRFAKSVSFRNAAATLVFQKAISVYLASGNLSYRYATYGQAPTVSSLDAVLQPLFSTESLQFQCGVAGLGRREKLAYIAGSPMVQKHLDVCVRPVDMRYGDNLYRNCGTCEKCIGTLISLEGLGMLDKFGDAFDLEAYGANRKELYRKYRAQTLSSGAPHRREDYFLNRKAGVALPPLLNSELAYLSRLPHRAVRKVSRMLGQAPNRTRES